MKTSTEDLEAALAELSDAEEADFEARFDAWYRRFIATYPTQSTSFGKSRSWWKDVARSQPAALHRAYGYEP